MPLQTGDIRFALPASTAQQDIGGGPPTSQLVPDGSSNAIFPDISEDARTGGLVEIVHLHGVLRNTDVDALLGANIIVAEPPDDPNVSITLIKSPGTFARRPDMVKRLEATSTPGGEFSGYLWENHIAGQRGILILQRPGVEPPSVNTTLALVYDEGLTTERSDYVRVRRVTVTQEIATLADASGNPVDVPIQVANCELFSELDADFPGSPASRFYARSSTKTKVRRVNFSDAGTFYSAGRLTADVEPTDMSVNVGSIYVQLVPNTKTETPLLNQMPGGLRTVDLVDNLGTLQVTAAGHTERLLLTEVTNGYAHVLKLVPPPAPGSITISYVAAESWQTFYDDGIGNFGDGPGSGTALYSTGDVSITVDSLPDYNTYLLASWADTASFVNLVPSSPVAVTTEPPEFVLDFFPGSNVNAATLEWLSGGVTKTATASAAGVLSGDATGLLVSALGKGFVRPSAMPDPGTNFTLTYASRPAVTESFTSVSVDSGGFAALSLADEPIPGTFSVRWVTSRTVSVSSGSDLSGTTSGIRTVTTVSGSSYTKTTESTTSTREVLSHAVSDDGAGNLGSFGTVNYGGKAASVQMVTLGASTEGYQSDHEDVSKFITSMPSVSG
ncbi:MAG: hypothetical protein Q8S71_11950 [Hydrogenophaga sp.]|nr:hypothetical protein [Hydrogenophaga sp.]